jgi:5,10-methylenetetrahydromethanopterin reductase
LNLEYGINFNGDLPFKHIIEGAKIAEQIGFKYIWVGEADEYIHPFPVLAAICENTTKIQIGSGIISPQLNLCHHILKAFETLQECYGPRFIIGLAPGDFIALQSVGVEMKKPIEKIDQCLIEITGSVPTYLAKQIKKEESCIYGVIPVFVGATGPKTIEFASLKADGILLNYLKPEYIQWALKYFKRKIYTAIYGPSLLLPDSNEKHLLIAAAIVASSMPYELQIEFEIANKINQIKTLLNSRNYSELVKYKEFLYSDFTISGTFEQISKKIEKIEGIKNVDQVIFGTPMCRSLDAIKKLSKIIKK